MKFRRLAASFAAAVAIGGAMLGTAAVASAQPDMTNGNKVSPTTYASSDTVCTGILGQPSNQLPAHPCRHHHHHHH